MIVPCCGFCAGETGPSGRGPLARRYLLITTVMSSLLERNNECCLYCTLEGAKRRYICRDLFFGFRSMNFYPSFLYALMQSAQLHLDNKRMPRVRACETLRPPLSKLFLPQARSQGSFLPDGRRCPHRVTKTASGTSLVSLSFTSKRANTSSSSSKSKRLPRTHRCSRRVFNDHQECTPRYGRRTWSRLDGTLKEINGFMKGLLVSQSVEDVHAIIALVEPKGEVHVSSAGRGEAYLIGMAREPDHGIQPWEASFRISSTSAVALEPQDGVVFSTQRLLRSLTPAQLSQWSSAAETPCGNRETTR